MSEIQLTVPEGNEPLLTITAINSSTGIPYNLSGPPPSTVTAIIKASADTPDASAIATIPATIVDGPAGQFTVQIPAAATASPGRYFYKINAQDSIIPNRTQTLQHGDFVVVNV